jgi:hypothetical protein
MRRFASILVLIDYTDTLFRFFMRRFCFFLLAVLFPLQLFAGALESVGKEVMPAAVCVQINTGSEDGAGAAFGCLLQLTADAEDSVANGAAEPVSQSDSQPDSFKVQADLEDQTLPAPLATLVLDWQPFPHLYPHVGGSSSAVLDLLRPPPLAAR